MTYPPEFTTRRSVMVRSRGASSQDFLRGVDGRTAANSLDLGAETTQSGLAVPTRLVWIILREPRLSV